MPIITKWSVLVWFSTCRYFYSSFVKDLIAVIVLAVVGACTRVLVCIFCKQNPVVHRGECFSLFTRRSDFASLTLSLNVRFSWRLKAFDWETTDILTAVGWGSSLSKSKGPSLFRCLLWTFETPTLGLNAEKNFKGQLHLKGFLFVLFFCYSYLFFWKAFIF